MGGNYLTCFGEERIFWNRNSQLNGYVFIWLKNKRQELRFLLRSNLFNIYQIKL